MKLNGFLKWLGLAAMTGLFMAGAASCSDSNGDDVVGMGTVSGTVTDEQLSPLAGVKVILHETENSVTTDAQGKYTLSNVPMTSRIIVFEKDGYESAAVTVTAKKFGESTETTVDVAMVYANASIKGTVIDADHDNAPLAGATVKVSDFQTTETDAQGNFELRNLTLKDYTLTVQKEGYPDVVKQVNADSFVDGVAELQIVMGSSFVLRGLTKIALQDAPKWYYNEYRGGRNAENYPHWDWACNYMCTLEFMGDFEEQNEGTTLRIRNTAEDQRNNPADMEMFDSFVYGSKLITADNCLMTLESRTHNASDDAPAYFGVQVVDLSEAEPVAHLIGGVRTLASENYQQIVTDLSAYIGKEVIIAIGTFRHDAGDYWKQFVIRRIAFTPKPIESLWAWLPGTEISGLEGWKLTLEMVRSTMPQTKSSFTGISPISGNRDDYFNAYRSWRDVAHVAAEWSYMPLTKDPEVFPSEGFLIKTRGGDQVNTKVPESYFYSKFSISEGHNKFNLTCRNFGSNYTFFKITAITNDGKVTHLSPVSNNAQAAEAAADGCWKFKHDAGTPGDPGAYCTFVYDLSQFNGQDVTIAMGVFKGEENGDENKLCFYSINLN